MGAEAVPFLKSRDPGLKAAHSWDGRSPPRSPSRLFIIHGSLDRHLGRGTLGRAVGTPKPRRHARGDFGKVATVNADHGPLPRRR